MARLVENEVFKVLRKKRLHVILAILVVLIGLFTYGEQYTLERTRERVSSELGVEDTQRWQDLIKQQISDLNRRLESPYIPEEGKASLKVRIEQLEFFLTEGIDPISPTAARFMGEFMEQSVFLLLPLLIILLGADMVSGEMNTGTIKMLLTRPVRRWKILLAKWIALMILSMLVVVLMGLVSLVISLMVFGVGGFDEPVITGFKLVGDQLDTSVVRTIPQWYYLLMVYAIGYYVALVIASLTLMVSVLMQSTAASIGVLMSTLIGGSFLSYFIADWAITRYLFTVNLNLIAFLSGSFQVFEGLNMLFSTTVLFGWMVCALFIAFVVFERKDIYA